MEALPNIASSPSAPAADPRDDPQFTAGIAAFNAGDYFAAHEHWEDLWLTCASAERRFYQGLIHAAVALYHLNRGNRPGATRLFDSGRRYMSMYTSPYRGIDIVQFWEMMATACADLLQAADGTPLRMHGSPPQICLLPMTTAS